MESLNHTWIILRGSALCNTLIKHRLKSCHLEIVACFNDSWVILCHSVQKIYNEIRAHLLNPPQGVLELYFFGRPTFSLGNFTLLPPSLHSGTLTQFVLVLYGTCSSSSSSSDKPQPANISCKTLDLRQICIGESGTSCLQFGWESHNSWGSEITEPCWDVSCGVAWIVWREWD